MISNRQLFLQHVGQTSEAPLQLEIEKAEGVYMFDSNGKKYIDLISGVSVSNVGHRHPKVIDAIKNQLDKYMHLTVYGEYIQSPQVKLAKLLSDLLPKKLNSTYFVNSGSEANEGALKLAKRYTGRTEVIACKNAYHGSTHGTLSLMSTQTFKTAFRPLVPGVNFIEFNNIDDIKLITHKTACVILEPIQGEGGYNLPKNDYLKKLRERCNETGTLLIFDEVQMAFGRTGKMFAFENFDVIPDIITFAKGLGGGMPIGAFVSDKKIMDSFKTNPILGHITTFGGHPVSCAAAIASIEVLLEENIIESVNKKGKIFYNKLINHPQVKEIRGTGLFYAIDLKDNEKACKMLNSLVEKGVVSDFYLFCETAFRIAPPLTITENEINLACDIIIEALNEL